ncbi:hypothetical protein C8J55DRAFT_525788 [Lentinula edodes]|uniref:Uncharacterized protein n=1 Tax=Lentinula lateritia TaxID=40482 RepID=A0A9W9DFE0_9AGAR|nr:hypothetical protein C8J55DRAFT_525788 [Lentinula edodes]
MNSFLFSLHDVHHDGLRIITAESARHSSIIRATLLNFTFASYTSVLLTSHYRVLSSFAIYLLCLLVNPCCPVTRELVFSVIVPLLW